MTDALSRLLAAPRGEPVALLLGAGWQQSLLCTEPIEACCVAEGDEVGAFSQLDAFLRRHRQRVAVGWLGYELGADVEDYGGRKAPGFGAPVLHVAAYARAEPVAPVAPGSSWPPPPAPIAPAEQLHAHVTRADYERRVRAVVEHIGCGDIFQANLTQPFSASWHGDPRLLFWRLCEVSPAPFAAYVEDGRGTAVLSSSPEEFLRQQGQQVRTRPIKGTRPRSADPARDAALLQELLHSDKDLAELAMIVDLLRNDLGKVAETGSVEVGPFPEHASFAQVHHLFATVSARLRAGVGKVDLLRATFPGGSITGCPKLRCLEVLDQLEVARRGVYTGAIGCFGPGEQMHLNIAIRTLVCRGGQIRANAGGGITALSDAAAEYDETLHKMAGLEAALQRHVETPTEPRP